MRLFLGHAGVQSRQAFFRRLFDEGHVLSQVLFGGDFSLITPFLLGKPKGSDGRSVFLIQFAP